MAYFILFYSNFLIYLSSYFYIYKFVHFYKFYFSNIDSFISYLDIFYLT